jgi:hypothetical protein
MLNVYSGPDYSILLRKQESVSSMPTRQEYLPDLFMYVSNTRSMVILYPILDPDLTIQSMMSI